MLPEGTTRKSLADRIGEHDLAVLAVCLLWLYAADWTVWLSGILIDAGYRLFGLLSAAAGILR